MQLIDVKLSYERLEEMMPTDSDGNVLSITEVARDEVKKALGIDDAEYEQVEWHTPGAFDVRYGSSYAASAKLGNKRVRFHGPEGDFQEGDDKV